MEVLTLSLTFGQVKYWVVVALLGTFGLKFWGFLKQRRHDFKLFERLGIPGPKPSFWTGNLREIRSSTETPMKVMDCWGQQYGTIYGYFAGTRPTIVVSELELVKQILLKNPNIFSDRPHCIINPEPLASTLVALRGERWKRVRNVLSPLFSCGKMREMSGGMKSRIVTMLSIIDQSCRRRTSSLNVWALFQGLTCDVIGGSALGMKVNAQLENESDQFLLAVRGFLANAVNPFVRLALCLPLVASLAETAAGLFGTSDKMTRMLVQHVNDAIEMRRGKTDVKYADFLQFILDAGTSNCGSNDDIQRTSACQLTDKEIVANAWVFILGGFETTASALTFASYLIAKHPQVQEKLAKELETVLGDEEIESISFDKLRELRYLDQVICECLRLFPPVVTFMARYVQEDFRHGPVFLPKGTTIQIPLWQIHHDPQLWPQPEKFDPSRFSEEEIQKRHPMAYMPFGIGGRSCIGRRFAELEVRMALASVLRKFRLELAGDEPLELFVPTVSLTPKNGVNLRFTRRN